MKTIQLPKYKFYVNSQNPLLIISAVSSTNRVSAVVLRVNSWLNLKCKTNPKQTQTKPIFWRPNPILSPKMRILDKFRTTFLCKTNPNYVIGIQIAVEYELPKNIKNTKQSQSSHLKMRVN